MTMWQPNEIDERISRLYAEGRSLEPSARTRLAVICAQHLRSTMGWAASETRASFDRWLEAAWASADGASDSQALIAEIKAAPEAHEDDSLKVSYHVMTALSAVAAAFDSAQGSEEAVADALGAALSGAGELSDVTLVAELDELERLCAGASQGLVLDLEQVTPAMQAMEADLREEYGDPQ